MAEHETHELKRELGPFSAAAIVAGSMIGSGIFIVSADVALKMGTAPLLLVMWIFAGVVTILGATSYGKLAAHLPHAGGQYVYLREAWGEIPAFLYGWASFWVVQTGFLAAVSVAFVRYLGVLFPELISTQPLFSVFDGAVAISSEQLVAVAVLIFLTWFNTTGVKNGAMLQNVFTSLKVLALVMVLVMGLWMGQKLWDPAVGISQWTWTMPLEHYADAAPLGLIGLFAMATTGPLFSSDAWNYVTFIGGEIKDPHRNIPLALFWGTLVVVVLYFLVNVAYLNLLSIDEMAHVPEQRVASAAMGAIFGPMGASIISSIILISTFGCLNGMMLAGARVFYAMAKDGLLFKAFGEVHPVTRTPNFSLIMQCVWGAFLALSGTYDQLLAYIVFTGILFYILTLLGLMKMGRKDPEGLQMTRWIDYALPTLYIIGVSYVAVFLLVGEGKWFTSVAGIGFTLTGLPVYFIWKNLQKKHLPEAA